MAPPNWCTKYAADNGLAEVQCIRATTTIMTPTVDLRLNAGFDYPGGGWNQLGRPRTPRAGVLADGRGI